MQGRSVPEAHGKPGGIGGKAQHIKAVFTALATEFSAMNRFQQRPHLFRSGVGVVQFAKDGGKTAFCLGIFLLRPENR